MSTPSTTPTSSLTCSLDRKHYSALLTGLIRRRYHHDNSITNDVLCEQLFTGNEWDQTTISTFINNVDNFIQHAAHQGWDVTTLETHVTEAGCNEEQRAAWVHAWKKESSNIHASLVSASTWSPSCTSLAWRIDVATQAKGQPDINRPSALIQMGIRPSPTAPIELLSFEMTRDTVQTLLTKLEPIDQLLASHS